MAQPRAKPNLRPDHNGPQRAQFNSNKKKIYATQEVCGICGKRVDFSLKFPHPLSPCIDHPGREGRTSKRYLELAACSHVLQQGQVRQTGR